MICLSRAVPALVIFLNQGGLTWFFPAVGAFLFMTVGYCAWRGERWAYYSLMFMNIVRCILSILVVVSLLDEATRLLTVFLLSASIGGGLLLLLSEGTHRFMGAQRKRFASESANCQ